MLPKAVYDQFRRLSNFYFLIVAAISFIPNISPSSPITTTLPLIVVVGFGLARDVFEDTKRKRSDYATNSKPVVIRPRHPSTHQSLRNPAILPDNPDALNNDPLLTIRSRDVFVGDVIRVTEDTPFPADLILLESSDPTMVAYVSTANLDGESNLKRRSVPASLQTYFNSGSSLEKLDASIAACAPNANLYDFEGAVTLDGSEPLPLDTSNLLLRGSILRNTEYIYGLVVYNGEDTKVALNMRNPPSKLGGIERMMNRVVIGLFSILMLVTILMSVLAGVWQARRGEGQWYMGEDRFDGGASVGLRSIGTFIILFHTFVPVSLFVTLEFVRLFQGMFISADLKMRTGDVSVDSKANNLNESLGYVQHIFSDKTGTLTENVMRFVACFVGGKVFDLRKHKSALSVAAERDEEGVQQFIEAMALTHDVIPRKIKSPDDTHGIYSGESPDEVALVEAASNAGAKLVDRTLSDFVLGGGDHAHRRRYKLLAELEFSSERKRMSTVFRCPDGKIRLFSKGADSVMLNLLTFESPIPEIERAADNFSKEGLRTLIYGYREIPEDEYEGWASLYAEASHAMDNRTEKKEEAAKMIELGLDFLGVTAVEDKLQDNVPGTIQFLREAGIRVWVLTGDKRETAENIGYSSHLLSREMRVLHVAENSQLQLRARLEEILQRFKDDETGTVAKRDSHHRRSHSESTPEERRRHRRSSSITASILMRSTFTGIERDLAMVIDGLSLSMIEDEDTEALLLEVAGMCKSVICARVTPLQKAQVVKMVRKHEFSNTLAIGDGGNDVSMIQEAHIGVGIKGKEGMQASRAADYSMGEFQHLRRLLAVHGRFSYIRAAGVINLSFYKNIFFSTTQILFQFFCFASGTTFHNQWIVTSWNAILTLIPPFLYGLFERDLEEGTVLRFPSVYGSNANNKLFSMRTVLEFTIAYSVWHALVLFWLTYLLFGYVTRTNFESGLDSGFYLTGLALSTMAVPTALFKFLMSSHLWTKAVLTGIIVSFGLLWVLIPVFVHLAKERELEGVLSMLFSSANYHLLWPVVFVVAFIPDFLVKVIRIGRKNNTVAMLQVWEGTQGKGKRRNTPTV